MIFYPPKSVERWQISVMTGGVGGGKLSWLRLEVGESLLVRNWRAAREDTSEWLGKIMAAAQVAKKLKDKRQRRTIEGIFNKVHHIKTYFSIKQAGAELCKAQTSLS